MRPRAWYRLAIRAFPTAARRAHRDEMLATLAELEGDPGHQWQREALSLVAVGARLRARGLWLALTPRRLTGCAAIGAGLIAMAPASVWAEHLRAGHAQYAILDGPTPVLRWLLVAAAATSLMVSVGRGDPHRLIPIAAAAGVVNLLEGLASELHRAGAYPLTVADAARLVPSALLLCAVALACGLALSRMPAVVGVRVTSGALTIVCVTAIAAALRADPPSDFGSLAPWQLRPAGLLSILTIVLTGLALVASRRVAHETSALSS